MSLLEPSAISDELVLACIDRGLDRVGANVKYLVYWHLHTIGHIKRTEIPDNPQNFAAALTGLYHESAACVERAIVQEINISFGLALRPAELVKAINEAREKIKRVKAS